MLKKDVVLRESLIDGLKYSKYLSDELIKQDKSVQDIIKNIISIFFKRMNLVLELKTKKKGVEKILIELKI